MPDFRGVLPYVMAGGVSILLRCGGAQIPQIPVSNVSLYESSPYKQETLQRMSKVLNSIKNSFKHPEDPASDGAAEHVKSSERSDAAVNQGDASQPHATSTTSAAQGVSQPSNAYERAAQQVPSTGYVGDNTGGRFPGEGTGLSQATPSTTTSASKPAPAAHSQPSSGPSSSSDQKGPSTGDLDPNNNTGAQRETMRENDTAGGKPGGDPS